jgi:hypothetical protein
MVKAVGGGGEGRAGESRYGGCVDAGVCGPRPGLAQGGQDHLAFSVLCLWLSSPWGSNAC